MWYIYKKAGEDPTITVHYIFVKSEIVKVCGYCKNFNLHNSALKIILHKHISTASFKIFNSLKTEKFSWKTIQHIDKYKNKRQVLFVCTFPVSYNFFDARLQEHISLPGIN